MADCPGAARGADRGAGQLTAGTRSTAHPGHGAARDDLGHPFRRPGPAGQPAQRVVSLVPSLTESVAVTRPAALAGATDWCSHPAGLDVPRVRGTKNPDLRAVAALAPDVVLANQEENRRVDVERLRAAGIPVWVTVITTVDEAFASLGRLFAQALGWPEPGWLGQARAAWREPALGPRVRAAIPVWRDPWMVVGSGTFAGDVAARLGLDNVYRDHPDRYPRVRLEDLADDSPGGAAGSGPGSGPGGGAGGGAAGKAELIVLPDEPYPFGPADGPEAFPGQRVALVEGRSLTWYGPSLVTARAALLQQLAR